MGTGRVTELFVHLQSEDHDQVILCLVHPVEKFHFLEKLHIEMNITLKCVTEHSKIEGGLALSHYHGKGLIFFCNTEKEPFMVTKYNLLLLLFMYFYFGGIRYAQCYSGDVFRDHGSLGIKPGWLHGKQMPYTHV